MYLVYVCRSFNRPLPQLQNQRDTRRRSSVRRGAWRASPQTKRCSPRRRPYLWDSNTLGRTCFSSGTNRCESRGQRLGKLGVCNVCMPTLQSLLHLDTSVTTLVGGISPIVSPRHRTRVVLWSWTRPHRGSRPREYEGKFLSSRWGRLKQNHLYMYIYIYIL